MKNYEEMTSRELKKVAAELKIKNYSRSTKDYLLLEIKRILAEREPVEKPKKPVENFTSITAKLRRLVSGVKS